MRRPSIQCLGVSGLAFLFGVLGAGAGMKLRHPLEATAPDAPAPPYNRMAAFVPHLERYAAENSRLEREASGDQVRVVFLGASIVERWPTKDPAFFRKHPDYLARGISGETSAQILLRARQDAIELKPKVLVLLVGTNDIATDLGPPDLTVANIASTSDLARAHGIRVVLSTITPAATIPYAPEVKDVPRKIAERNTLIRAYAAREGLPLADFTPALAAENGMNPALSDDGLHPNRRGYQRMDPLIEAAVEAVSRPAGADKAHAK